MGRRRRSWFKNAKEGQQRKEIKVDRDRIFWAEGIASSRAQKDAWIGQVQEIQTNQ